MTSDTDAFTRFAKLDLERVALLFDVDGTLIDLGPSPFEVDVPDELKDSLQRLIQKTSGALALVSGRPVRDLDTLFAPLRLPAIGGHGAETRLHENETPERIPDLDPALRRGLAAVVMPGSGLEVEDKGYSIALHFRKAPHEEERILRHVLETVRAFPAEPTEVLPGKEIFEVKHPGVSKGHAVRALMQREPFAGRIPVFIGDDVTDESVFAVMPELRGINFSVSRPFSCVEYVFSAPAEVRRALAQIAAA